MKQSIVADGAGRMQESADFQTCLRQLHDSIWERHADEFTRGRFFRRLILRWEIWRDFLQERRKLVPSAGTLYAIGVSNN